MGYFAGPFEADVVTVSHEHFDHNALTIVAGKPQVLRGLTEDGKDWRPVQFENKDVKITSIPVYHDDAQGAKRGKNAMFLFETEHLRILHTGDLGHTLTTETLAQVGRVDVLLICVGGFYTLDAAGARTVIGQIKPRVVVPMHYKTDPKSDLPITSEADFLKGWKHVQRLETDEWVCRRICRHTRRMRRRFWYFRPRGRGRRSRGGSDGIEAGGRVVWGNSFLLLWGFLKEFLVGF
jgi:L-ascorbate metabolism protein UlaG (beta-lactamase superfamily)